MTKETGGPAFPPSNPGYAHGMTIRDYFAAKAMQGMMHDVDHPAGEVIAGWAYEVADEMLKARNQ